MSLYKILEDYPSENIVPMHMPGHKRNMDFFEENEFNSIFQYDITEIDGFDNLHNPTEIIKDSLEFVKKRYSSQKSWYLVNGSSAGIIAALMACTNKNDRVAIARNCHVSVYNALLLNELKPVYIYPDNVDNLGITRGISLESIENAILSEDVQNVENFVDEKIKAIIITSPTYEGFVSDVSKIVELAHVYNIPVIVDEAHGAHFGYEDSFPKSALEFGADIVIQSLHKTLPSLTSTAIIHLNKNALNKEILEYKINRYVDMLQTTSPSYLLMASMDKCIRYINSSSGREAFNKYVCRLKGLRENIKKLTNIKLLDTDDISKIVLYSDNSDLQGKQLYDILLHTYGIQLEMASLRYCIAMTSVADKEIYYDRFLKALTNIDKQYMKKNYADFSASVAIRCRNNKAFEPYQIFNKNREEFEWVEIDAALDKISGQKVTVYPPGIPVVVEGERISRASLDCILKSLSDGLEVIGVTEGKILCLR